MILQPRLISRHSGSLSPSEKADRGSPWLSSHRELKSCCSGRRPGDFYASGAIENPGAALEVWSTVRRRRAACYRPPAEANSSPWPSARYGRGPILSSSTNVRRAGSRSCWTGADRWQALGAGSGRGRWWRAPPKDGVVNEPRSQPNIQASIYDRAAVSSAIVIRNHRQFAKLVVVLPAVSTGGELVIRHKGREVSLALHGDEPSEAVFAASLRVSHEVLPVTSGAGWTLVYNLLRKRRGRRPTSRQIPGCASGDVLALLREMGGRRAIAG